MGEIFSLQLQLRADVGNLVFDELADGLPNGVFLVLFEPAVDEVAGRGHHGTDNAGQERALQVAIVATGFWFGRAVGVSRVEIGERLHIAAPVPSVRLWEYCDFACARRCPVIWSRRVVLLYTLDSCAQSL